MGILSLSQEYKSFRSIVPMKKVIVDDDNRKEWTVFDAGPKTVKCPVIFLPPASGSADVFFKQLVPLASVGYRLISINYPPYWTVRDFCIGFSKLLDSLRLDHVHVFGASLGGFLGQKFAEATVQHPRIVSLILCNAFNDTAIFKQTTTSPIYKMMPALLLRKAVMDNWENGLMDSDIADSVDFIVEQLDNLSQQYLASRLTLNCTNCYIEPQSLSGISITIIDVYDDCALSASVKEEMYKCYPDAHRAHLKSGGNFPFLSRSVDVNIFLQVHLRRFDLGQYQAREITDEEYNLLTS